MVLEVTPAQCSKSGRVRSEDETLSLHRALRPWPKRGAARLEDEGRSRTRRRGTEAVAPTEIVDPELHIRPIMRRQRTVTQSLRIIPSLMFSRGDILAVGTSAIGSSSLDNGYCCGFKGSMSKALWQLHMGI